MSRRLRDCLFFPLIFWLAAGCTPQNFIELLHFVPAGQDPDGDGSLASARPLSFINGAARVSAAIALDESSIALAGVYLGLDRGNFAPGAPEADVFDLGELAAGDSIEAELTTPAEPIGLLFAGSDQALMAMVLDAEGVIVGYPTAAPFVAAVPGRYYVVVGATLVGAPYNLTVRREHGRQPAPPRPQVVLLDFDGGEGLDLLIPNSSGPIRLDSLPPFAPELLNPALAPSMSVIKETTRAAVEAIYADYAIRAVTDADEAERLGPHARIMITAALPNQILSADSYMTAGIEPRLDYENQIVPDVGLVFAGLLAYRPVVVRGPHQLGVNLALIAAHELGHALGLLHVKESSGGLMRPIVAVDSFTAGELYPLLVRAPLSELRLGIQDDRAYLARVVGLRDPAEAAAIRDRAFLLRPAEAAPAKGRTHREAEGIPCWRCAIGR